jgi:hypothetical protein
LEEEPSLRSALGKVLAVDAKSAEQCQLTTPRWTVSCIRTGGRRRQSRRESLTRHGRAAALVIEAGRRRDLHRAMPGHRLGGAE